MNAGDNRLTVLAAEIRDAHVVTVGLIKSTTEKVIEVGGLLTEAKSLLPHGGWASWLRDHCNISQRTATRYMRLAASGLNWPRVANIGIRAAEEALAQRQRSPKPEGITHSENPLKAVVVTLQKALDMVSDDLKDEEVPAVKAAVLPLLRQAHRLSLDGISQIAAAEVEKEGLDRETTELTALMRMRGCRGTWGPRRVTLPDDLSYDEWVHIGRVLRTLPGYPGDALRGYVDAGVSRVKRAPFNPLHTKSKMEFLDNLVADIAHVSEREQLPTHDAHGSPEFPPKKYEQMDAAEWWDAEDGAS